MSPLSVSVGGLSAMVVMLPTLENSGDAHSSACHPSHHHREDCDLRTDVRAKVMGVVVDASDLSC